MAIDRIQHKRRNRPAAPRARRKPSPPRKKPGTTQLVPCSTVEFEVDPDRREEAFVRLRPLHERGLTSVSVDLQGAVLIEGLPIIRTGAALDVLNALAACPIAREASHEQ